MLSLVPRLSWLSSLTVFLASLAFIHASPIEVRQATAAVTLSGPAVPMDPVHGGTYPRANRLADGSLIGVISTFANGSTIMRTLTSTDNGASWQELGVVTSAPSNANDVDNPFPLQLPSGRILIAFRNHSKDPSTGAYTFFRITICYSDDGGKTWAYLSQPASDPGPVTGNWEPFMRMSNLTVQLYYSRENSAADQDSLMRTSTDGGLTWSTAATISGAEFNNVRDGMVGVAVVPGRAHKNELLAVFESEAGGFFTVDSIRSHDGGMTWGERSRVYTPAGNNTNAGAPQIVAVGHSLLVSFMTDEDTGKNKWVSGADAKVVVSHDGGYTWSDRVLVGPVESFWPGMVTIDRHAALVMYDHGGPLAQKVIVS